MKNSTKLLIVIAVLVVSISGVAFSKQIGNPESRFFLPQYFKYENFETDKALDKALNALCRRRDVSTLLLDKTLVDAGGGDKVGPSKNRVKDKDGTFIDFNTAIYSYPPSSGDYHPDVSIFVHFNDAETLIDCSISIKGSTAHIISYEKFK